MSSDQKVPIDSDSVIKMEKGRIFLSIAVFIVAHVCGGVLGLDHYIEDAERFPGWKGALPKSLNVEVQDSTGFEEFGKVRMIHKRGVDGLWEG